MNGQTDRVMEEWTDGQSYRQTDNRQKKVLTDSQMEKQRDTLIGNIMGENMSW